MTKAEVQRAARFLQQHGYTPAEVDPATFLQASRDMDVGFSQLLRMIGSLLMRGQGLGPAPVAIDAFRTNPQI